MQESERLAPHPSNPQDVLATWHALRALPAQLDIVTQHFQQRLSHIQTDKHQLALSLADAKADLVDCLDNAASDAGSSRLVATALRAVLLTEVDVLKV